MYVGVKLAEQGLGPLCKNLLQKSCLRVTTVIITSLEYVLSVFNVAC